MAKVSVIIPVYNVEEYLHDCMESVVNQTLKDIEIICVNDGSTDNSRKILQEYADKDSRVKIIDQENQGQGVARNNGIAVSTGEYLGFVDSDDWIDPDMYEVMYNNAKKFDSDLVETHCRLYNDYYKNFKILKHAGPLPVDRVFDYRIYKRYLFGTFTAPWNKLYKSSLVKENNIQFAKFRRTEDCIFAIKSRVFSKKITYVDKPLYVYRIRTGSVEHKKTEEVLNLYCILKEIIDFTKNCGIYEEIKDSVNEYVVRNLARIYEQVPENCKSKYDKICRELLSDDSYQYYCKLRHRDSFFIENVFSLKNFYDAEVKYKVITILGLKFKYVVKNKKLLSSDFTEPIDLVYLWCNDSDPVWHNKRREFQKEYASDKTDESFDCRYSDNDELKISLRSVEKYLPWINKIFIVTDNQVPDWLDTNNQQIVIVNHKEIIPEKYLPTFNSNVIETYLHHIPGLSEYFLYANDDTFVNTRLPRSFFFDENKKPVARFKDMRHMDKSFIEKSDYLRQVVRMQKLIKERFGKSFCLDPHHNIDAYTKTICAECEKEFLNEYNICRQNKFRQNSDVQRCLIYYYAIIKKQAVLKLLHKVDSDLPLLKRIYNLIIHKYEKDSVYISVNKKDEEIKMDLNKFNPKMFCLNDSDFTQDEDRIRAKKLLHDMFPEKSYFEKEVKIC